MTLLDAKMALYGLLTEWLVEPAVVLNDDHVVAINTLLGEITILEDVNRPERDLCLEIQELKDKVQELQNALQITHTQIGRVQEWADHTAFTRAVIEELLFDSFEPKDE